jgi:hypothetical protein
MGTRRVDKEREVAMRWALPFYGMALLAFLAAGYHILLGWESTNSTFTLAVGMYCFMGLLSVVVGNAFWAFDRRLRGSDATGKEAPHVTPQ